MGTAVYTPFPGVAYRVKDWHEIMGMAQEAGVRRSGQASLTCQTVSVLQFLCKDLQTLDLSQHRPLTRDLD